MQRLLGEKRIQKHMDQAVVCGETRRAFDVQYERGKPAYRVRRVRVLGDNAHCQHTWFDEVHGLNNTDRTFDACTGCGTPKPDRTVSGAAHAVATVDDVVHA